MKKSEILEHLRDAKTSHQKWVHKAKLLTKGISLDEKDIPVDATQCKLGKWLYGEAQSLVSLQNNTNENIKKIEELHSKLHDQYLKIFSIYFEDDRGFFAKLFSPTKKISTGEQDIAEDYYDEIEKISEDLIKEIEALERKIIVIPEKEIEKLF